MREGAEGDGRNAPVAAWMCPPWVDFEGVFLAGVEGVTSRQAVEGREGGRVVINEPLWRGRDTGGSKAGGTVVGV